MLNRRTLLAAGALPWASLALAAGPATSERRLVLLILRGGLDGLQAVPAPGDPAFAEARGVLGRFDSEPLPLAGPFALHPQLPQLHAMYRRQELLVLHAIGLPYHERSHFDAQQVLESGGQRPHERDDGWLGRALAVTGGGAIGLSTAVPLALRGAAQVDTWAPSALPDPSPDLLARLERLYAGDPALGAALGRARTLQAEPGMAGMAGAVAGVGAAQGLATRAAEFLSRPGGPGTAVLELGGWDSHANQAAPQGALTQNLKRVDAMLAALHSGLGPRWAQTVVLVVTEFGRQVAVNGTQGTDHGSGGVALLAGGAVRGGRVLADWPGLAPKDRFEGRDLRSTTDLRALLHGVLHEHLQVPRAALDRTVLPGVAAPLRDIVRA
ncbi:MAG: DUF1501 domain-containing protein [Rubrivivax sp.]|nr:DUF1501 domain-containing protein [Rubrivivax sp.]